MCSFLVEAVKSRASMLTQARARLHRVESVRVEEVPSGDADALGRPHHLGAACDLQHRRAVNQLPGRYAESVADYGQVHHAMLRMSDMLSDGIIAQFPEKF